jgi:hypothetical protein
MAKDNKENRTLSIRISTDGFCFCDYIPSQPDSLDYFFYATDKARSLAANLRMGIEECPFIGKDEDCAIKCIIETAEFTTIPFEFDNKEDYRRFYGHCFPNCNGNIEIVANRLNAQGFTIIFPVEKGLYDEICSLGEATFYTPASILAGFVTHMPQNNGKYMLAYLQGRYSLFISVKEGHVELMNIFGCDNGQDMLFYLLSMWKEQGFSQTDDTLYICGDRNVEENMLAIGKFIRHKNRLNPNGIFAQNRLNMTREVPFDLQTLILCE